MSIAAVHGWKSTRFEQGKKLRDEIEALLVDPQSSFNEKVDPHLLREDGEKEEYYEDAERELSLEHEVHRLTLANVAAEEYIKLLEQRRY